MALALFAMFTLRTVATLADMMPIMASMAPAPSPDMTPEAACETCALAFDQCGGQGFDLSISCCDDTTCIVKNAHFAQCLDLDRAARNVENGWNGEVAECGMPMPEMAGSAPVSEACAQAGVDNCANDFEQCGGARFGQSIPCCHEGYVCTTKNSAYAQCIPEATIDRRVALGWDGTIIDCEPIQWPR